METKCSVCLAAYNGEKYIQRQVKSIIDQLGPEDELIISDDSSTDGTLAVINAFDDNRIKVFQNEKEKGPTGNFSTALAHASSDYIFLADQDDLWLPGRVKKHLELLQNHELVISDAVVVNEHGRVLFESFFKARNSGKGFFKNLKRNSYIGCCMSFRRSLLTRAFPFPKGLYMHDWWLGLVAELKGNVYFCNDIFLQYIRHADNVTQTLEQSLPLSQKISNRWGFIKALVSFKMGGKI